MSLSRRPAEPLTAGSTRRVHPPAALRYVALGDSYTIGTAVRKSERWPDQLVACLGTEPPTLELVANLAVEGRTSAAVIRDQLPALDGLRPGFVSLLIGVNDVVQGVAPERYGANVAAILDALLARLPASRVLTVSTPDYTVSPAGADYGDPARQAAAIRACNAILAAQAGSRAIAHVDIHDLSLGARGETSLVAADGLHPSGAQYSLWVARIAPVVEEMLRR